MGSVFCWFIDADGVVWSLMQSGTGAQMSPSGQDCAQEISGDPSGTGWIISTQPANGDNVIMWWTGDG